MAPVTVTGFPQGLRLIAWSLVIDEPTAAHQLDTSRIALMKGPFQVEYYADVEWTNNAPPGTAVADPIVPEHRAPAGSGVDPSDPLDGFSAALQLAEVSG